MMGSDANGRHVKNSSWNTGLVLATRLSENPSTSESVLVWEAGGAHLDDDTLSRRKHNITPKTEYSHGQPRGKGFGGSSAINNLLWKKPALKHIEAWGALVNDGWTWEKFQTYSKKSERRCRHVLSASHLKPRGRFQKAMEVHNVPTIQDSIILRGGKLALSNHDFLHLIFTQPCRTSPSLSTLDPSTHRRSYATNVTEIVTTNLNGIITATGVKFVKSDNTYTADVAGEVCLTSGAIMSPQILEMSGIGDPAVLERAGFKVKLDLPGVGTNVQEHLYSGVTFELTNHFVVIAAPQCEEKDAGLAVQYKLQAEHLREKVPSLEILYQSRRLVASILQAVAYVIAERVCPSSMIWEAYKLETLWGTLQI
ncbi:hypothetical protein DEU56DRAFT_762014 [Suillus clintonianus]|uniref:uncharacterized protein n=1 Tax=Suillus clintonianus TaxID=1904413 RepID=UPI001B86007F|nr:uncharacterized protein DEU56DRAFT_762014 [Suillus clintonianus]KAG2112770.1 hypothetical protein DEU56DRAFT_762014 [Suillus clintonianus]